MKPVAKTVNTPVGEYKFPFNSHFLKKLERCRTNNDLFKLVKVSGHVDVDAITEVKARDLENDYRKWQVKREESKKWWQSCDNKKALIKKYKISNDDKDVITDDQVYTIWEKESS